MLMFCKLTLPPVPPCSLHCTCHWPSQLPSAMPVINALADDSSQISIRKLTKKTGWQYSPVEDTRVPGTTPVKVEMHVLVRSLCEIDCKTGTTSVDLVVQLSWRDPRLAGAWRKDPSMETPSDLWRPAVSLSNAESGADVFVRNNKYDNAASDIKVLDLASGAVCYEVAFCGLLDNPMPMANFPFDEDSIPMLFVGDRLRDGRPADAAHFELVEADPLFCFSCADASECTPDTRETPGPTEYGVMGTHSQRYTVRRVGIDVSVVSCGIYIARKPNYYLVKVMFLMWMVAIMSQSCYLYPPQNLDMRMRGLQAMFLAAVGVLYTSSSDLPKTETLNKIDSMIVATIFVLFSASVESMVVYFHYFHGHDAEYVDVVGEITLTLTKTDLTATDVDEIYATVVTSLYWLFQFWLFGPSYVRHFTKNRFKRPEVLDPEVTYVPWRDMYKILPGRRPQPRQDTRHRRCCCRSAFSAKKTSANENGAELVHYGERLPVVMRPVGSQCVETNGAVLSVGKRASKLHV